MAESGKEEGVKIGFSGEDRSLLATRQFSQGIFVGVEYQGASPGSLTPKVRGRVCRGSLQGGYALVCCVQRLSRSHCMHAAGATDPLGKRTSHGQCRNCQMELVCSTPIASCHGAVRGFGTVVVLLQGRVEPARG